MILEGYEKVQYKNFWTMEELFCIQFKSLDQYLKWNASTRSWQTSRVRKTSYCIPLVIYSFGVHACINSNTKRTQACSLSSDCRKLHFAPRAVPHGNFNQLFQLNKQQTCISFYIQSVQHWAPAIAGQKNKQVLAYREYQSTSKASGKGSRKQKKSFRSSDSE